LRLNEFFFEGFESFVIEVKFQFECPIRNPTPLVQERDDLVYNFIEFHCSSSTLPLLALVAEVKVQLS
jgi:hypothetical protein